MEPSKQLQFIQQTYLPKLDNLITKLKELLENAKANRLNCLIAKTTGTSVAGVGAATMLVGLIGAPFTLGISFLVVSIVGAGLGIVGSATTLGTSVSGWAIESRDKEAVTHLLEAFVDVCIVLGRTGTALGIETLVYDWKKGKTNVAMIESNLKRFSKHRTEMLKYVEDLKEKIKAVEIRNQKEREERQELANSLQKEKYALSELGNYLNTITFSSTQQTQGSTSSHAANTDTFAFDEKEGERFLRAQKWKQYKVEEFLGSGSFGFVFKIQKNPNTIPSAVKIVVIAPKPNLSSDAGTDEVVQANRELQAMQILPPHQNVVELLSYDVLYPTSINLLQHYGDEVGLIQMLENSTFKAMQEVLGNYSTCVNLSSKYSAVFIEMGLCGPTLRTWLRSDDTIRQKMNRSEEFAQFQFDIAQGIINGLKHLHDNRMMHRDLKPENIYFSFENSTDRFVLPVKIGDLGVTRQISEQAMFNLTKTKPRGTLYYRAKEVDDGLYGPQADLFSLGLVLWEVFDIVHHKDIKRKFEEMTVDRKKSLIKQNPWVPNLLDTIFNLTYRDQEKRTKSIDNVKLEFKSQTRKSSSEESEGLC